MDVDTSPRLTMTDDGSWAASPPCLRPHAAALRAWDEACERAFLDLGGVLQRAHAGLKEACDAMLAASTALLDHATEEELAALQELAQRLPALLGHEAARGECLDRLAELADRAAGTAGQLLAVLNQLRQLMRLARINVVDLAAAGGDFAGFIGGVGNLLLAGERTVGEIHRCLAALAGLLAAVRAQDRRRIGGHAHAVAGMVARLVEIEGRLRAHRQAAGQAAEVIRGRFEAVRQDVGQAVMRMQFQDAARQRLEHVLDGLVGLERVIEAGRLEDEVLAAILPPPQRRRAAHDIARLEAAQLEDLARQTEQEIASLRTALAGLAQNARKVEADLLGLVGGDRQEGGASALLAVLDAGVAEVQAAFTAYRAEQEGLHAELAACDAKARRTAELADALVEIEEEMRLAGLNATLKAARLGRGGAVMQEIARAIRERAVSIGAGAADLVAVLRSLLATADRLVGEVLPQAGEERRRTCDRLAAIAAELHRQESTVAQAHRTAQGAIEGIVEGLAVQAGPSALETAGPAAMRAAAAELARLGRAMADGGMAVEPWPALEALLRGRYTMGRERDVHAACDGGGPTTAATAVAAASLGDDDLADILF